MDTQLETFRLLLRPWKAEDKIPFARMNANAHVMAYFPRTLTPEESDEFIMKNKAHFKDHDYGFWAVELKETQAFIGFIGLFNTTFVAPFIPCIEIGWRIDERYWNKGYATEGAKACLEYGFTCLGMKEIYAFTSPLNKPSIQVMKKIGLEEVGTFYHPRLEEDSPLRLHVLYKIDKERFDSLHAQE